MGLIFSLLDVTSAQEVLFSIPQYMHYFHQGLISVLLCNPFISVDSGKR